jgi:cytochrome P450
MTRAARFVPAMPMRTPDYVPVWRGFFGERLRNTVHGWPEPAFEERHKLRSVLGLRVHIITGPDMIERVLLSNKANYLRPRVVRRILSSVIGNGLLSAEGEDWRVQRKIVAPTFAPGAVAALAPLIDREAQAQVARWATDVTRLDMAREATQATMAIITSALFSGDPRLASVGATQHIEHLLAAAGQARFTSLLGLQDFDPSPVMMRARRGRRYLRSSLETLVRERGPDGGGDDFFGGLIRALHAHYPADQAQALAVDNAITFFVAGHETTANALAWTIYLLAAQPDLQEEARAEVLANGGGDPTTLPERLPLLRAILDEAMRLYPPAPRFDREAQADDDLCGVEIRKGDLVSVWPWVIHRHRTLWDYPDAFDHTRFLGEAKAAQHRFQYIPFGGGPRVCVGARFAIVEAMIILARWLAARRFSLPPGFRPDPVGSVTLRPRGGMPLVVERV